MRTVEADVLVVGGGIVGGGLATALRDTGHRVALMESRRPDQLLETARGDHLQPYTADMLERWGVLDDFFAHGAERRYGQKFFTADGELILEQAYDDLPIPHPYGIVYHHELISELFLELAADGGVEILRPSRARRFDVHEDGLRAVEAGGVRVEARLVVAADGSSSAVRGALGIGADSYAYNRPFVDLFGPELEPNPRRNTHMYVGPVGMTFVIPRLNEHVKIGILIEKEDVAFWKRATAAERIAHIANRAPALAGLDGEVGGFYPVKMVNAHRLASGNAVLIGDAAHAMHPIMGMGMNMALREAESLVDHIPAPDEIGDPARVREALAGYEAEQLPKIVPLLERNHVLALEVDDPKPTTFEDWLSSLRALVADDSLNDRFLMDTTGYPGGYPQPR